MDLINYSIAIIVLIDCYNYCMNEYIGKSMMDYFE